MGKNIVIERGNLGWGVNVVKNYCHCAALYYTSKGPYSQSYGFSSSHVRMWELDHNEGWVLKNWCFWTVVLEKTLENPLDCSKEIKSINPKGNWPWIFIGRTDAEAEAPKLRPQWEELTHWKKTLKLEKTEGRRRRGWQRMRWLDGITNTRHKFEQTPRDSEGQGSLVCCSPWGYKELDVI